MATRTGQIKPKSGVAEVSTITPRFIGDSYIHIVMDGETEIRRDYYVALNTTSDSWVKLN